VREYLKGAETKIVTVVGFPLGFQFTRTKAYEAAEVVASGADEIDVVINLRWVKERRWEFVSGELNEILATVPETVVKAIIECGYLTRDEMITLVDVLADCRVHYLKTSTGFGPSGARVEDVRLLAERAAGRLKIKAAGGIRTLDQALALLQAGADCLGTSHGVQILEELLGKDPEGVEIFVDGACLRNPGPGGYAAVIKFPGEEKVLVGGEKFTTNNRMELMAAIKALEALKRPSRVRVYTDSRYLKDGITLWLPKWERNGFKTSQGRPVKNQDLWQRLAQLTRFHQVEWHWIRGHKGHPENERCDRLAREEARKQEKGS
jgi:deoxyribose-phosphate aldolase